MFHHIIALTVLLSVLLLAESKQLLRRTTQDAFECILIEVAAELRDQGTQFEHACEGKDEDGDFLYIYHIDDNYEKIIDQLDSYGLGIEQNSGRYRVTMTNVDVTDAVVTTSPETQVTIQDQGLELARRHLGEVIGSRTIVVFRVTEGGNVVSYTADQIRESFFGSGENSMTGRFKACSMDKLDFVAGTGTPFTGGVGELTITTALNGADAYTIQNVIWQEIKALYGYNRRSFDHVVLALPGGTTLGGNGGWLAYAEVNNVISVYNDNNIMYISNQVHETAHNLGLAHSGDGTVAYGDQSGVMGYGHAQFDTPRMCFNAPKSWQLGWYDDRSLDADPAAGKITTFLDAYVDYRSIPSGEYAVMKIGNHYAIYNRKKGINDGTTEYADTVNLSSMDVEGDKSWHQASLGAGQSHSFSYGGGTAIFEVCEVSNQNGVDKAQVAVYMSGQPAGCAAQTPTPAPTQEVLTAPPVEPTTPVAPSFCFPGDSLVQGVDGRKIRMKDLKIGDFVQVEGGKYEPIYSFGHYALSGIHDYIVLNDDLVVSHTHMVAVNGRGFVPASGIKVGDEVFSGASETVKVDSVSTTMAEGAFAPFTYSGTIVVNNILASSFVSMQGESGILELGDISTGVTWQWMAMKFEVPHRLISRAYFGMTGTFLTETYTEDGLSSWISGGHVLAIWLRSLPSLAAAFAWIPVLSALLSMALLDFVTSQSIAAIVIFISGTYLSRKRNWRVVHKSNS